jgi:hypothetical protein
VVASKTSKVSKPAIWGGSVLYCEGFSRLNFGILGVSSVCSMLVTLQFG